MVFRAPCGSLASETISTRSLQSVAPSPSYDLLVLGAGVAGLISCIVGRQLGRSVALVEPRLGGERTANRCMDETWEANHSASLSGHDHIPLRLVLAIMHKKGKLDIRINSLPYARLK